jgi:hypothetical protein
MERAARPFDTTRQSSTLSWFFESPAGYRDSRIPVRVPEDPTTVVRSTVLGLATPSPFGEALRDDANFCHTAVWEYQGNGRRPERHTEPLQFTNVLPAQRSCK